MKNIKINKRALRVRKKLKKVNKNRYRLSIFRSLKNISAQIIDDKNSKTLLSVSSMKNTKEKKIKKTELSIQIAELLAKKALEMKITNVYFDRGKYKYHGRVKSFAESLRKNGLNF